MLTSSKIVTLDRFGQEKPHPAVQIERMASMTCAGIVAQIVGKSPDGVPAEQEEDFFG